MKKIDNLSIFFAICIGALYSGIAIIFWRAYDGSPINEYLLNIVAMRENHVWSLVVLYTHDMVINLLLALPFSLIFLIVRGLNDWKYLSIALFSSMLLSLWSIVSSSVIPAFEESWVWFGIGLSYLSLPIAFSIVRYYYNDRVRTA